MCKIKHQEEPVRLHKRKRQRNIINFEKIKERCVNKKETKEKNTNFQMLNKDKDNSNENLTLSVLTTSFRLQLVVNIGGEFLF